MREIIRNPEPLVEKRPVEMVLHLQLLTRPIEDLSGPAWP
jgi:hypothetical protein